MGKKEREVKNKKPMTLLERSKHEQSDSFRSWALTKEERGKRDREGDKCP